MGEVWGEVWGIWGGLWAKVHGSAAMAAGSGLPSETKCWGQGIHSGTAKWQGNKLTDFSGMSGGGGVADTFCVVDDNLEM